MKKYEWNEGTRLNVDANIAGKELERIEKRDSGVIRPEVLVSESRPKKAPLHPCFTWDDAKAAELYRLGEARLIIRSIRVLEVFEGNQEPQPIRGFVHVSDAEKGGGYQSVARVMSSEELRLQAINYSIGLLNQAKDRLAELRGLEKSVRKIEAVVRDLSNGNAKEAGA
jgi:hypothetical protein